MPVNGKRRCMGCMSPLAEEGVCPVCGYNPSKAQMNINYLAPGSNLGSRYLVGKMTSCDTEGAWYVGFDAQAGMRVWVREYAPKAIIMRDYDSGLIQPLPGIGAQYKALMSDFEDLCASIRRLPQGEKVLPILDVVRGNNTVYAIYRYIKMISLESFLKRSGGKLSWRHAKKLLMPLFHTVAGVHNAGLIHRGLSPRTVEVDQNGSLWLTCFSIAAARTNKSELTAQLYEGYAAPEQYSQSSWQGTWTDVYALGAITYRAVLGQDPPSALDRVYGDDLLERMSAPDMTESAMTAINRALAVEVEDRTQTAEAYIADLLANEGSNTAVYTAPAPRRVPEQGYYTASDEAVRRTEPAATERRGYYDGADLMAPAYDEKEREEERRRLKEAREERRIQNKKKKKKKHKAHPVLLLILSAFVATSLLGITVYWFANTYLEDLISAVQNSEPEGSMQAGITFSQDEQTAENGKVATFIGATLESIESNAALDLTYEFITVEGYSDEYDKGVVYQQSPKPGEALIKDGKTRVTLYISEGAELVEMPEVVGKPTEEVETLLNELHIPYQPIEVVGDYESGIIVKCNKKPGDKIDITRSEKVLLYIKKEGFDKSSSNEEEDDDKLPSRSSSSRSRVTTSKSSSEENKVSSASSRTAQVQIKDHSSSYPGLLKPRS